MATTLWSTAQHVRESIAKVVAFALALALAAAFVFLLHDAPHVPSPVPGQSQVSLQTQGAAVVSERQNDMGTALHCFCKWSTTVILRAIRHCLV